MTLPPDSVDEEIARQTIVALATPGPFGHEQAMDALSAAGVAADVEAVLQLLVGRQVIVKLGGEPERWELVID